MAIQIQKSKWSNMTSDFKVVKWLKRKLMLNRKHPLSRLCN